MSLDQMQYQGQILNPLVNICHSAERRQIVDILRVNSPGVMPVVTSDFVQAQQLGCDPCSTKTGTVKLSRNTLSGRKSATQ